MAQQVKNPTSTLENMGSIPHVTQWVKDLALLQAAGQVKDVAWIWLCCAIGQQLQLHFDPYLAWELPYVIAVALGAGGSVEKL